MRKCYYFHLSLIPFWPFFLFQFWRSPPSHHPLVSLTLLLNPPSSIVLLSSSPISLDFVSLSQIAIYCSNKSNKCPILHRLLHHFLFVADFIVHGSSFSQDRLAHIDNVLLIGVSSAIIHCVELKSIMSVGVFVTS